MKPLHWIALILATLVSLNIVPAQNLEPATGAKPAPKPKDSSLSEVTDTPGLPRVLLIGDSISMGYTLPVRARLKGIANVHRPVENCGDTARGLARLDLWLGTGHWDVIHFNFGLHDLKYLDDKGAYVDPAQGKQVAPPAVYRQRLTALTRRLQATGAKLIFATTTPVPPGTLGRVPGDDVAYNQVAREVMKQLNVAVDDLGAYVAELQQKFPPHPLSDLPPPHKSVPLRPGEIQQPFNVHFTPLGYDHLADHVVASIKPALPAKP